MGFENKYPYTDFHELNLDWILEVVKGIETEWPEFRTEMQNAWQQYQDNLTGEGGEWPTFRDEMTQDFDDFIHLFIDEFDNMHAYTVGDYVVQDGQVYKCEALPSPSHALPIEFDEYTWLRISNGVINQFSHEIMAIESSVKTFVERMVPEYSDQEYYNKDRIVRKPSTFAPTFPYDFYIAKQLITPETWTPSHWERVNSFAQAINDVCAINKQEMQDQYDQFLEDYQRTFGVVQTRGYSTTDVMSQKAVSDELDAIDDTLDTIDDTLDDIESGHEVVGHANVADNLTPYSEDSGAIQDTPFISQETGTANNTVIVTTGDTAKQLEKLGYAVVNNQLVPVSYTHVSYTLNEDKTEDGWGSAVCNLSLASGRIGHRVLVCVKTTDNSKVGIHWANTGINFVTGAGTAKTAKTYGTYILNSGMVGSGDVYWRYYAGATAGTYEADIFMVDITQYFNGDTNIPADLLANPSHFSWYYNGELTYNAGSIEHGEGVKLVCTRGRNLFNGTLVLAKKWQNGTYQDASNSFIACEEKTRVVPNSTIAVTCVNVAGSNLPTYVVEFDENENYIDAQTIYIPTTSKYATCTLKPNTHYVALQFYRSTPFTSTAEVTPTDITPYYTEQQGGEGYGLHYNYEEPDIIDTGTEQLGAFDKKTPDGVITRGGTEKLLNSLTWSYRGEVHAGLFSAPLPNYLYNNTVKTLCSKYTYGGVVSNITQVTSLGDKVYALYYSTGSTANFLYIYDSAYTDVTSFVNHFTNTDTIEYQIDEPYTEQGTSFRQYASINDYGIMYWLDANDELVSIPQGLKIQYPVNYKGFTDDLYMYTNGDATALAKNVSITDAALQARGYLKLTALSGYDATKTQTLKNIQGVFTWVDD